ncbi:MAG TPA: hypothetical protein PKZ99_14630 [Azospirillaceae bacterium]|nr:hypothetical protein [Azospirillaceae bacterium]
MIDLVIDAEGIKESANWRREKAVEFPWDAERNLQAAAMLDKIAIDIANLEGSELHKRLSEFTEGEFRHTEILVENWSSLKREIGFHTWIDTGAAFIQTVIDRTKEEIESESEYLEEFSN